MCLFSPSLRRLSDSKSDRLQIKDQRGRFHYEAISLLYHANNLLKPSAIIFSPSRCLHSAMAATNDFHPFFLSVYILCLCGRAKIADLVSLFSSVTNIIHNGSQGRRTYCDANTHGNKCVLKKHTTGIVRDKRELYVLIEARLKSGFSNRSLSEINTD